ncbi:MAG: hypothetical protein WKG07_09670 [Hymenobacter sp.]
MAVLGAILAFLLLVSTVHAYVRARLRLPATTPVTPTDVWAELRARLGRMPSMVGLFIGGYVVLALVLVLVIGGLVGAGKALGSSGSGLAFGVILIPIFLCLLIYASIALSLLFPVLWLEDRGLFCERGPVLSAD